MKQALQNEQRPNFLIAGAAKAGTTSLYEYLRQHPQIFLPELKEPHYFTHDFGVDQWRQYVDLFAPATGQTALGEASTGYLCAEESPGWIKAILGDIKIILILRNPAQRAFSLYCWMVSEGYENAATFAEALELENVRRQDQNFRRNCPQFFHDYLYFQSGLYAEQVARYFNTFGRENVRIYFFKEFIENPLAVCADVFNFLEVRTDIIPKIQTHNASRLPHSILRQFWLRTQAPQRLRFMPRAMRAQWIRRAMEQNLRQGSEPQADPKIFEVLTSRYQEDIGKLEQLLGRDLKAWSKPGLRRVSAAVAP